MLSSGHLPQATCPSVKEVGPSSHLHTEQMLSYLFARLQLWRLHVLSENHGREGSTSLEEEWVGLTLLQDPEGPSW